MNAHLETLEKSCADPVCKRFQQYLLAAKPEWYDLCPLCSEFASVAAHLETLEKSRADYVTGKSRACTADDYASLQFKLAYRQSGATSAAWSEESSTTVPVHTPQNLNPKPFSIFLSVSPQQPGAKNRPQLHQCVACGMLNCELHKSCESPSLRISENRLTVWQSATMQEQAHTVSISDLCCAYVYVARGCCGHREAQTLNPRARV